MTKVMKITLTASANTQEGIEREFDAALSEILKWVEKGVLNGANSRSDGDSETNLEYTEGAYEFETREI